MQADATLTPLTALSPLDGRYRRHIAPLAELFSEIALIRERVHVEVAWLGHLTGVAGVLDAGPLSADAERSLWRIAEQFSDQDAARIKEIERRTNHDVKAVEYFIRERSGTHPELATVSELIHFACTSEDINNLAYGLLLHAARDRVVLPALDALLDTLADLGRRGVATPMLARTHGQPATPTTVGKELANFVHRLGSTRAQFAAVPITGKLNGAVGNFNAHCVAFPELDWPRIARDFVESLGLVYQPMSTQIEPHDELAGYCHALARINTVLLDLDRDLWGYIALGYFKQKPVAGEIGSSTMPHKVNPIDFENSEGNLGIANALLGHFAGKLPVSRFQRDLSDSTVLRNLGVALGHSLVAFEASRRGLDKLEIDAPRLQADLDDAWAVLAEPVQTVLRRHGVTDAYEMLKELTRGRPLDRERLHAFIRDLPIPQQARTRLLALTPASYLGNAVDAAQRVLGEPTPGE